MTAQLITTVGILCDIVGAILVANEVVRVFRGPTTIDVGGAGYYGGTFVPKPNPEFEAHEARKRMIMKWGLGLLIGGFLLQLLGAWWPIINAT